MEEKGGISPSRVNRYEGNEESLGSKAEFQQNPSFIHPVGPTTLVSPLRPPPPPPPPLVPVPVPTTVNPGSASGGSDPTKKKRGRPRKYAPDGSLNPRAVRPTLTLSQTPILSGDYYQYHPHWKRQIPQPVDFLQKSHRSEFEIPALPPLGLSHYVGADFTTHQFTVNAGEDVTMKIMPYSKQGCRAICILSATGTISNVTLRQPTTSGGTLTYEGRFEILSLSGSYMPTEIGGTKGRSGGMSISLAGPNGKVIGGGLAGLLIAASPVQVVIGSFIVMNQAEQNQKQKPQFLEASAPPHPQQQPPIFTITTVNSTVEVPKQQPYGGGGIMRPMGQMPASFHSNNPGTIYYNPGSNKEEDGDEDGGDDDDDDDSGDNTRSLSNSG